MWNEFIYYASVSGVLSVLAAVFAWFSDGELASADAGGTSRGGGFTRGPGHHPAALAFAMAGIAVFSAFIVLLWLDLNRPPLRTMGETRLWYSFFSLLSGLFVYIRWRYRWMLSFSTLLAVVFMTINCLKPEIHDESLMPALQSPWFIPHVTVYMFSYSILGCSFLMGILALFGKKAEKFTHGRDLLAIADNLVYIGLAFLTFGMLSGALWAKEAWGNYWTWDPKETWALITWGLYMLYIHCRLLGKGGRVRLCLLLIMAFMGLQMCWYGVNYLPSAKESVHLYK